MDIFDLICHIAWDAPALTRKERAENIRKRNYWTKYGEQARKVLDSLLEKYAETGIANLNQNSLDQNKMIPFRQHLEQGLQPLKESSQKTCLAGRQVGEKK